MGSALVPVLGHAISPCPACLSTTDNADDATRGQAPTTTNADGEIPCTSPGVRSPSVVDPAPRRTHLAAIDETTGGSL